MLKSGAGVISTPISIPTDAKKVWFVGKIPNTGSICIDLPVDIIKQLGNNTYMGSGYYSTDISPHVQFNVEIKDNIVNITQWIACNKWIVITPKASYYIFYR